MGVTRQTVRTWRDRFAKHRLNGIDDEPRCGAPRKIGDDRIEEIVTKTLETKPADATHWSTRGMAKAISQHNANPKPLRWTKSADDILATIERFCRRTLDVHAQTG